MTDRERRLLSPSDPRYRSLKDPSTRKADAEAARRNAIYDYYLEPADPIETEHRHASWQDKRRRVRASLARTNAAPLKMQHFDECGSTCYVQYSATLKRHRLSCNTCRNRHCEPCMRARAGRLSLNLVDRLQSRPAGRYRFITLTLLHSDMPLADQIARLYRHFRALRARKSWKKTQRGGAAVLEVKWIAKTRRWHPHLHVISEGAYLDKTTLSKEWHSITGDSYIVDIRKLDRAKDAANYVAKYVAKGSDSAVWFDDAAADEWVVATKGVRACATYGTWRGYKLMSPPIDPGDWHPVGKLTTIITAARANEPWALGVLKSIRSKSMPDYEQQRLNYSPIDPTDLII